MKRDIAIKLAHTLQNYGKQEPSAMSQNVKLPDVGLHRLVSRLAWLTGIGWEHLYYTSWLHGYSHLYQHKKTGEKRWHHEAC